jgi:hypothetical protein
MFMTEFLTQREVIKATPGMLFFASKGATDTVMGADPKDTHTSGSAPVIGENYSVLIV